MTVLSPTYERVASNEAFAVSVLVRAAWAAMRVASATAAAADSGSSFVVVYRAGSFAYDRDASTGIVSKCIVHIVTHFVKPTNNREPPRPMTDRSDTQAPDVETDREEREAFPGWPPRDFLQPFVLLAVSLQRAHGYAIEDYLRGFGLFGITMSTLYRTLRQMEKDGFLE